MKIDRVDQLDSLDLANSEGLLNMVVQDARDGRVLMEAWSSREAVERTLATGQMHFFSPQRNRVWRKGEISGNVLPVTEIVADLDNKTLLAVVRPRSHSGDGATSNDGSRGDGDESVLARLDALFAGTANDLPEDSYARRLLQDRHLRLKKLAEESGDLVVALADGDSAPIRTEAADLLYHVLAACRAAGVGLDELLDELARRGDSTA